MIIFIVWSFLNTIAWGMGSTAALPFRVVVFIFILWIFIYLPLTIIGGLTARIKSQKIIAFSSDKTPRIIKKIPSTPW